MRIITNKCFFFETTYKSLRIKGCPLCIENKSHGRTKQASNIFMYNTEKEERKIEKERER